MFLFEQAITVLKPVRGYQLRIFRNVGAMALAQLINISFQLVSVPLFLSYWGAPLYGEWLILNTIPAYFTMSDVGFATVSATEMTMLVTQGDRASALKVFQSAWVLVTVISLALLGVTAIALFFTPLSYLLRLTELTKSEIKAVVALLTLQMLVGQQMSLLAAGFRCEGRVATGVMWSNLSRLVELLLFACGLSLGARPLAMAGGVLGAKVAFAIMMRLHLTRLGPWITFGWRHAEIATIRRLGSPAIMFMAFPLGFALRNQAILTIIGVLLGPVSVVTFATTRTLTNLVCQLMGIINNSVWPELSAAFAAGDLELARTLHRRSCQASLWLSLAATTCLLFFGGWVYQIWTRSNATFDYPVFYVLLVGMVANAFWFTSLVVPLANNTHQYTAGYFLLGTLLAVLLSAALIPSLGLIGASLSLLVIDVIMLICILPCSLRLVQDRFMDFARSALYPPSLHAFWRPRLPIGKST